MCNCPIRPVKINGLFQVQKISKLDARARKKTEKVKKSELLLMSNTTLTHCIKGSLVYHRMFSMFPCINDFYNPEQLLPAKSENKNFRFFSSFLPESEENERERGLETDHLF